MNNYLHNDKGSRRNILKITIIILIIGLFPIAFYRTVEGRG
jgi:hypothetical protein